MLVRQHAFGGLLRDKETTEDRNRQCLLDFRRVEVDEGTAGTVTGVVNHHVRRTIGALNLAEKPHDIAALGRIASKGLTADVLRERRKIGHAARRKRYLHTGLGKGAGHRRGKSAANANNEGRSVWRIGHGDLSSGCRTSGSGYERPRGAGVKRLNVEDFLIASAWRPISSRRCDGYAALFDWTWIGCLVCRAGLAVARSYRAW